MTDRDHQLARGTTGKYLPAEMNIRFSYGNVKEELKMGTALCSDFSLFRRVYIETIVRILRVRLGLGLDWSIRVTCIGT